jgi:Na+/proline symporter
VALSSSDTITFMLSSIFTRDLKNYTNKYSEESMKKLTRFFMLFFVAITVVIAIFYQNIIALGLSMGSLSLALFPVIFGSFYWKLKERAVFWSLFLSFVSGIIIFVADKVNPQNAAISLPVALISLIFFQKLFKKESP